MFRTLRGRELTTYFAGVAALVCIVMITNTFMVKGQGQGEGHRDPVQLNAQRMVDEGRQIFRFDTFGDEMFWGGQLRLHEAVAGASFGGVGPGLSPRAVLDLGLKVDVDALPNQLIQRIRREEIDFNSPGTTLALLKLNAVVGLTGFFDAAGNRLTSIGIQCALCHSTVNDSFLVLEAALMAGPIVISTLVQLRQLLQICNLSPTC